MNCDVCGLALPARKKGRGRPSKRHPACQGAWYQAYLREWRELGGTARTVPVAWEPMADDDPPALIEARYAARLAELRRDRTLITTDPWAQPKRAEYVR